MIVAGRLVRLITRHYMSKRQRKTVNFSQKYVIDDIAVQRAEERESEQHRDAVFGMVSSAKLQVDPDELKTLHEGVKFGEDKLDRRLLYEVAHFRYGGDQEDYSSDDESDQDSSDSGGQSATSPSGLSAASNQGNILTPTSRVSTLKTRRNSDTHLLSQVLLSPTRKPGPNASQVKPLGEGGNNKVTINN